MMCHIQCCNKQGWYKPSERLPQHQEKVIIRYKLYSDMRMDLANFYHGKHKAVSGCDDWYIYGVGHGHDVVALLKTEDVQYWHPISDLPKE